MDTLAEYIADIKEDVADAYSELSDQGATLPTATNRGTSNLGSTIASIPHPELAAPTISRNGNNITISNPSSNGGFVTGYDIYTSLGTPAATTITGTTYDFSTLPIGDYVFRVIAKGQHFTESDYSNRISASVFGITRNLTNLTANNNTAKITSNQPYTVTITPESGYYLPEFVTVLVNGAPASNYTYDSYTGVITIPAATGSIQITAAAYSEPKLRQPKTSMSGTVLTVEPPRYAETTKVYVDDTLMKTITGTSQDTYDLSTDFTAYGIYAIKVQSSATGYADSNYVYSGFSIGATIQVNNLGNLNSTVTIVDVISGVSQFNFYVDGTLIDCVDYDGSSSWALYLSDYKREIADGQHEVQLEAIGNGIAPNRSNKAVWFKGVAPVYGVSGLADSSPALTRTDEAWDLEYFINSSSGSINSDFDTLFPWNKTSIVYNDAGKFVSFPEMYFRIGTDIDGKITDVAVSEMPRSTGNWYRVAPFLYGCYGASVADNKMRSATGVERSNYSRANYRTRAFAVGEGFIPIDLYHRNVLMLLWWIEFATKKSDSIMSGRISGSGTMGGNTRRPCGGTDNVETPSGYELEFGQMRYHYIEDFVGNVLEMVDGICMNNVGQYDYVTADPTKFGETNDGKTALPWVNPANQEIAAFGWDPDNPFLFMPIAVVNNGSYNTYFCDQVNHASGSPVMRAGASCSNASAGGGLSGVYYTNATNYNADYGSRLLKIS